MHMAVSGGMAIIFTLLLLMIVMVMMTLQMLLVLPFRNGVVIAAVDFVGIACSLVMLPF